MKQILISLFLISMLMVAGCAITKTGLGSGAPGSGYGKCIVSSDCGDTCENVCVNKICKKTGMVRCPFGAGKGKCVTIWDKATGACGCKEECNSCYQKCIEGACSGAQPPYVCKDGRCVAELAECDCDAGTCLPPPKCGVCTPIGSCETGLKKVCTDKEGKQYCTKYNCNNECQNCEDSCLQMCVGNPPKCMPNLNQKRCPDGRCVKNSEVCCPVGQKRCPDGSCVSEKVDCSDKSGYGTK